MLSHVPKESGNSWDMLLFYLACVFAAILKACGKILVTLRHDDHELPCAKGCSNWNLANAKKLASTKPSWPLPD